MAPTAGTAATARRAPTAATACWWVPPQRAGVHPLPRPPPPCSATPLPRPLTPRAPPPPLLHSSPRTLQSPNFLSVVISRGADAYPPGADDTAVTAASAERKEAALSTAAAAATEEDVVGRRRRRDLKAAVTPEDARTAAENARVLIDGVKRAVEATAAGVADTGTTATERARLWTEEIKAWKLLVDGVTRAIMAFDAAAAAASETGADGPALQGQAAAWRVGRDAAATAAVAVERLRGRPGQDTLQAAEAARNVAGAAEAAVNTAEAATLGEGDRKERLEAEAAAWQQASDFAAKASQVAADMAADARTPEAARLRLTAAAEAWKNVEDLSVDARAWAKKAAEEGDAGGAEARATLTKVRTRALYWAAAAAGTLLLADGAAGAPRPAIFAVASCLKAEGVKNIYLNKLLTGTCACADLGGGGGGVRSFQYTDAKGNPCDQYGGENSRERVCSQITCVVDASCGSALAQAVCVQLEG
jgi:hypothetical protein